MSFDLFVKRLIPLDLINSHRIENIPVRELEWKNKKISHISYRYLFTDFFGNQNYESIDGAGIGETDNEARFLSTMELIERYSALSDLTIRYILKSYIPSRNRIHLKFLLPYTLEEIKNIESNSSNIFKLRANATGMISNYTYDIPAALVFPRWKSFINLHTEFPETEGSGIAAGLIWEKENLLFRALCEVIERESVMLSWRLPLRPKNLLNISASILENHQYYISKNNLDLSILEVGDTDLLPVIIVLLYDKNGNHLTLGSSCGKGIIKDIHKALEEAIMLRSSAKNLNMHYPNFKDIDIDSSEKHLIYGWRNGKKVLDIFLKGSKKINNIPKSYNRKYQLSLLAKKCKKKYDLEPLIIDITHPDLQNTPYRIYRVIQPNTLKKEYRHKQIYLGGKIFSLWKKKKSTLNLLPHPIA
ncbi:YcaO-like family protein [Tenacibaculum sp. C7A-26P2]|uniref:YcaO-like family protein n=1 Tax=Tenacibaculum sp. C7A-26P2 TaxID=3447504 RepID=UPI003F8616ED